MGLSWLSLCLKLGLFSIVLARKSKGVVHSVHHIPLDLSELRGISKSDLRSEELKYLQEHLGFNPKGPVEIQIESFEDDKLQFQAPASLQNKLGKQYQHMQQGLSLNDHGVNQDLNNHGLSQGVKSHGMSSGLNSHGLSPGLNSHGLSPSLSTHGLSPSIGSHGLSPSLGSHGLSPSSGSHGLSPSLGSHGLSPSLGSHGLSPSSGSHGLSPNLGSHGLSPSLGSHGLSPSLGSHGLSPNLGSHGLNPGFNTHSLSPGLNNHGSMNFHASKYPTSEFSLNGQRPLPYDSGKGFDNQPSNSPHGFNGKQYNLQSPPSSHPGPIENYQHDLGQNFNNGHKNLGHSNAGGHVEFYFKTGEPNHGFKSQTYSSNAYYYEDHKINHPSALKKRGGYYKQTDKNAESEGDGHGYENDETPQSDYNSVANKNGKKYKSYYSHVNNKQNKASYPPQKENGNKVQYNQHSPDPSPGHVSNTNGNYPSLGPKQQYGNTGSPHPNGENSQNQNGHGPSQQYSTGNYNPPAYSDSGNSNKNSPNYGPAIGNGNKKPFSYSNGYNGNYDQNPGAYQGHGNKQTPVDCSMCPVANGNNAPYKNGPSQGHDSYNNQGPHDYNTNPVQENGEDQYNDGPPPHGEEGERNHRGHVQWYSHGSNGHTNKRFHGGKGKHGAMPGQIPAGPAAYSNKPQSPPLGGNGQRQHSSPHSNAGGNMHHFYSQNPHANPSSFQQRKRNPLKMSKSPEGKGSSRSKTKPVIHEIYMSDSLIKDNDVFLKGIP